MNQNPAFFDFLTPTDQEMYKRLRAELSSESHKYKKNLRYLTFSTDLDTIKKFIYRNDGQDWKRALVCGFCSIGTSIAINTRQLRLIIDKSKSSINGALQKLGYSSEVIRGEGSVELISAIPFLKANFVEQRQWTIRRRSAMSPYPLYLYSPGIGYALITPQPQLPPMQVQPPKLTKRAERIATFGLPNGQIPPGVTMPPSTPPAEDSIPSSPEEEKPAEGNDFINDVCCCCPIEWESYSINDELYHWS